MTQLMKMDHERMPMTPFPAIDHLTRPVSAEHPSGEDIRYDGVVDQIKEARRADDQLDQGEWRTAAKIPDWRKAAELCTRVLAERSKDLQITVWLAEAWLHLHGFAGLGSGLALTTVLLNDFWATIHPLAVDGDLDYRVGPLALINEKLPSEVLQVPLCDPVQANGYGYYQWEESQLVGAGQNLDMEQKKRRDVLIKEGKISAEAFMTAVNATPLSYYRQLSRDLSRSKQALVELDETVTGLFAPDPPGFGKLMDAIARCTRVVDRILKEKKKSEVAHDEEFPVETVETEAFGNPGVDDNQPDGAAAVRTPPLQTRALGDISVEEKGLWQEATLKLGQGRLKEGMDQVLCAAALAPSPREKNRYLLMLAKLCLRADRVDLARPIAEELYTVIEGLNLDRWEHPSWIAEVVETLYRCMAAGDENGCEQARALFQKLCLLNVTRAAAYRLA